MSHVRLDVYPDGGMARVRLWGELTAHGRDDLAARWWNLLPAAHAMALLTGRGMTDVYAEAAIKDRPVASPDGMPEVVAAELAI